MVELDSKAVLDLNGPYGDVLTTWKGFTSHAEGCEPCQQLADYVRRKPLRPPYMLITACCDEGQRLVEAWIGACEAAIERSRDVMRHTHAW